MLASNNNNTIANIPPIINNITEEVIKNKNKNTIHNINNLKKPNSSRFSKISSITLSASFFSFIRFFLNYFQTSFQLPDIEDLLYAVAFVSKKLECSGAFNTSSTQGNGFFLTLKIPLRLNPINLRSVIYRI